MSHKRRNVSTVPQKHRHNTLIMLYKEVVPFLSLYSVLPVQIRLETHLALGGKE
jgi:hypothetical protein